MRVRGAAVLPCAARLDGAHTFTITIKNNLMPVYTTNVMPHCTKLSKDPKDIISLSMKAYHRKVK